MVDACGHCGKAQPFIPRYPDLGRCDHCGGMLAGGEGPISTSRLDRWVSMAIVDIVQHLPMFDESVTADRLVTVMKLVVERFANGNRARYCERIALPRWTLTRWLSGGERATLPQLLSVCYGLRLMPSKLLLSDPAELVLSIQDNLRPVPEKLFGRLERPLLSIRQRRKLMKELAGIINDPEDVRSLSQVARSLELTRSCMKYWFPEECVSIQDKHVAANRKRMAIRMESQREAVVSAVRKVRARGEYPARRKVNEELLKQKMSLIRPELLSVYRQAIAEQGFY
jgi:hypothetical protein